MVELVGGGSVINGATPSSLFGNLWTYTQIQKLLLHNIESNINFTYKWQVWNSTSAQLGYFIWYPNPVTMTKSRIDISKFPAFSIGWQSRFFVLTIWCSISFHLYCGGHLQLWPTVRAISAPFVRAIIQSPWRLCHCSSALASWLLDSLTAAPLRKTGIFIYAFRW